MGSERGGPVTLRTLLLVGLLSAQTPILAQTPPRVTEPGESPVEITFVDVGHGDATIIQGPDGVAMMVDAGPESPLQALSRLGVDSLALLVASHSHPHHVGGMSAVLTARPVARYLDSGAPAASAAHEELRATLARLEAVEQIAAVDTTLRVGALTVEVLAPDDRQRGSVGLVVRYGAFSALLPGDADDEQLEAWRRRGLVPDATLLKASGHGARAGFTHSFIDAVAPRAVVIFVGGESDAGLPRPEALAAYRQYADRVLRTDLQGHITVRGFPDGRYDVSIGETLDDRVPLTEPELTSDPSSTPDVISLDVVVGASGTRAGDLNGDYVTLTNRGGETLDLSAWSLCDLTTRCFRFPAETSVRPQRSVVVYTGYGSPDGVSFFMNNDRRVWNENGDEATLYDQAGRTVARHVY